jgi:GTPase SAR1 family protein
MGNFIQKIISSWSQQPTKIVMVGLDAAGKTTILYKLKLGEVITTARKTNGKTTPEKTKTNHASFFFPSSFSSGPHYQPPSVSTSNRSRTKN